MLLRALPCTAGLLHPPRWPSSASVVAVAFVVLFAVFEGLTTAERAMSPLFRTINSPFTSVQSGRIAAETGKSRHNSPFVRQKRGRNVAEKEESDALLGPVQP